MPTIGSIKAAERRISGQIPHFREVEEVAGTGAASVDRAGSELQDASQKVDLRACQHVRHDSETVAFHGVFWLKFCGYDMSPIGRHEQELFRSLAN